MITPGSKALYSVSPLASAPKRQGVQERQFQGIEGKWVVLYTYPKDFTFICPTEIVEFDSKLKAFGDRGAVLLGGSTDNEFSHLAWRQQNDELKALKQPLALHQSFHGAGSECCSRPLKSRCERPSSSTSRRGALRIANDLSVGQTSTKFQGVGRAADGELVACNWKKGEETLTAKLKRAG